MTVYVDDMNRAYRRMKMSHMIADTDEELHKMADIIGVSRRHFQGPPKHRPHYDICLEKKALAIKAGAFPISLRQAAVMSSKRKPDGTLPSPDEVEAIIAARVNKIRN